MVDTVVQLLLAALLLLTIVWCALVHQRLRRLRADKGEMEAFIGALTAVTERAEAAIAGLRGAGETTRQELERQEDAARRRTEDLARAMDGAQRMLRRLETGYQHAMRSTAETERREPLRPAATRDRPSPPPAAGDAGAGVSGRGTAAEAPGGRPRISEELLRVLQGLR